MQRVKEQGFARGVEVEERRTRMVEAETTKMAQDIMEFLYLKDLMRIGREIVHFIMHAVEDESLIVQQDRGGGGSEFGAEPAGPIGRLLDIEPQALR